MFDEKTLQHLRFYVYMLVDPIDKKPFYIGKGNNNRVYDHLACALEYEMISTAKYDLIRTRMKEGLIIEHIIVRHGLSEDEAFSIEASLIDTLEYLGYSLTNAVFGHHSLEKGLMQVDEIRRLYNAKVLNEIDKNCMIININRKYERGLGAEGIYQATRKIWKIGKSKTDVNSDDYRDIVLSEYRGLIVEVYKVNQWKEIERGYNQNAKNFGKTYIGWGFEGRVADDEVRKKYVNKSIAHHKKRGQASPIRYHL